MMIDEADEARQQQAGEAQTLRGEVKELKKLIGRYNHFVQSKERERISYACQAYR